jgi:hypothetical protein
MSVKRDIRSIEQRIQAVATRPRVTPRGTVFPRSDYVYTAVPTILKYMLDKDGKVIGEEESESSTDVPVLYVYEANAYYKQVSQKPYDDTQDADKPIFTKDSVDGVYKAASAIRLVSPVLLTTGREIATVNRGAYFEVINIPFKRLAPWTLVSTVTYGTYRIYIPDGSLILYLIYAEHESSPSHTVYETGASEPKYSALHVSEPKHLVKARKGVVTIDPSADPLGGDWYKVELDAGDVYVAIENGVVKITNTPTKYSSRIACILDSESGKIEQIASSTITLLIEEDSPDAPEPEDPIAPPCGHPGNEPGAGGESGGGDDTEHPGDHPGAGGDTEHPGDSPTPPSSGECE